jgi:hypothetical protein
MPVSLGFARFVTFLPHLAKLWFKLHPKIANRSLVRRNSVPLKGLVKVVENRKQLIASFFRRDATQIVAAFCEAP